MSVHYSPTLSLLERQQRIIQYETDAFQRYPDWSADPVVFSPSLSPPSMALVDLSAKRMSNLPFTDIELNVLCGTFLGDTSFNIQKNYKNARFQSNCSTRYADWAVWKGRVVLKRFVNKLSCQNASDKQEKSPLRPGEDFLGKIRIASRACEELTQLHNIICVRNKIKIQRFWLNHMNSYFLMTLWLDDGSLCSERGRQGVFCLDSRPVAELEIFRDYLQKVWGISTKILTLKTKMKNGEFPRRVVISSQEELVKFLRIIAPIIPVECMIKKVCFVPNNPVLLQRWRTELLSLVQPQFRQKVFDFYESIFLPCPASFDAAEGGDIC